MAFTLYSLSLPPSFRIWEHTDDGLKTDSCTVHNIIALHNLLQARPPERRSRGHKLIKLHGNLAFLNYALHNRGPKPNTGPGTHSIIAAKRG